MTANITIYTQVLENVMKIPVAATSFRPDSLIIKKYKINSPFANGKKQKGQWKKQNKNKDKDTGPKDEAAVWVIAKDSTLSRKKIKTGMDNDTEIQVVSGLTKNDNIITGYKLYLKNLLMRKQKVRSCLKEEVAATIKAAVVADRDKDRDSTTQQIKLQLATSN
jgi:HlyD family secretion protein